ncbi:MAG: hypothetical protein AAGE37_02865 [Pseudomonadota bacterium]
MIELLLTALLTTATDPPKPARDIPDRMMEIRWLTGQWSGTGTLFGNPVRMELVICPVAAGHGFALDYVVKPEQPSSTSSIFAGHALYWPKNGSGWSGRWVGSNGVNHQLDVRSGSLSLETTWSNADVETGRTSYALDRARKLIVNDKVRQSEGNFRQFATGRYERTGGCT